MPLDYELETYDIGDGPQSYRVYLLPSIDDSNVWANVTDVPCPVCTDGTIRRHDPMPIPGYRTCDGCGQHFIGAGSAARPKLIDNRQRTVRPGILEVPMWNTQDPNDPLGQFVKAMQEVEKLTPPNPHSSDKTAHS